MSVKTKFILTELFGNTVRIKILELLLNYSIMKDIKWVNISEIAKVAHISTSSSKRIVDQLIKEELVELNSLYTKTHAKNPEKEIRLNLNDKRVNELIFFYRKLKGFI